MSKMNFHPESLFNTFDGETSVWTQLQAALRDRDGDTFYRFPIVSAERGFLYEPDMVVALRGYMPLVLECKGCRLADIERVNGAVWTMGESWYRAKESPLNQARDQAIALRKMLADAKAPSATVHSLVVLPFIGRQEFEQRLGELALTPGLVFADDLALPERFAARILDAVSNSPVSPEGWNRLAEVLGARDRWLVDDEPMPPVRLASSSSAPVSIPVPQGQGGPGINILRYPGRPPTADELRQMLHIDEGTPYTYLVATAGLERRRRKQGFGGQHQLKKDLRAHVERPEEMQLVFHKALRHFMARPMLTRTEERVLIQRAIKALAQDDRTVADQLRRDVFAWRDVLAELEEQGVDLSVGDPHPAQWAHPELETIATSLQGIYRKLRCGADGTKLTFEEAARHYLSLSYVPTPIVVMEGFTRLTPLQQEFIECCARSAGVSLWIVLPYNPAQQAGFSALDRTYAPFMARARLVPLATPPLGVTPSLAHLQTTLFSTSATPSPTGGTIGDQAVSLNAFPHRNDEVAFCVKEVIRLLDHLAPDDLVIVCSDPQSMAPLLREEAELHGIPELFTVPPRQLLLTPVGRFILVLYEIWRDGTLEMEPQQFATLLAAGWLGAPAQRSAELFVAVAHQHFTFCRSEADWIDAFNTIGQQADGDTILGSLADRLPSSLVTLDDLNAWRTALASIMRLCQRIFTTGEKPIGQHISFLLDEIEQLDPYQMLQTERQVLSQIQAALADLSESRSVAIDAREFGEVLSSLIHERQDDEDGDLPGSSPGKHPHQVWVVGPEGVDNISCHTVFFLGADESRMPAPGAPPWPRMVWSADEHVERQRYRFLAVVRAAHHCLLVSYAHQDWDKEHQASPYLDEAARLLARRLEVPRTSAATAAPKDQASVRLIPMKRESYTLAQLATFRLCPYRFKMEVLTEWAGRYTSPWQLEWLARGVWLAETFNYVATQAPGRHTAEQFCALIETAIVAVRPQVQLRLPGLHQLAWIGVEHSVRNTIGYLLKPTGQRQLPLLGVVVPHPRSQTSHIGIGADRSVAVVAEADFQICRGPYLNFIRETNQSGVWLIVGSDNQPISEDADPDPHIFKTLRSAVRWWGDLWFAMIRDDEDLHPQHRMELADCIQKLEQGNFRKNPGDHCRYCPVADTCMGLKP
ncbi:NERD domain-containing protein [Massilia sp. 2TAF26]|uniref:NERD domain-containing protein n=1 Tax=Massilia sp. 2TAF26 TaxID=3233012 RepID=UPI003F9AEE6C